MSRTIAMEALSIFVRHETLACGFPPYKTFAGLTLPQRADTPTRPPVLTTITHLTLPIVFLFFCWYRFVLSVLVNIAYIHGSGVALLTMFAQNLLDMV